MHPEASCGVTVPQLPSAHTLLSPGPGEAEHEHRALGLWELLEGGNVRY